MANIFHLPQVVPSPSVSELSFSYSITARDEQAVVISKDGGKPNLVLASVNEIQWWLIINQTEKALKVYNDKHEIALLEADGLLFGYVYGEVWYNLTTDVVPKHWIYPFVQGHLKQVALKRNWVQHLRQKASARLGLN